MPVSKETLAIFRSVRAADITDALDSMGLQERYEMDPEMRPLFFGIRFAGIAHTKEYDLIDKPLEPMTYEEFDERQYSKEANTLWNDPSTSGAEDEVIVLDAKRTRAGIIGSNNTLHERARGVVGFVIDGTFRDSYESILQKTPAFCTVRSPAHPMGRIRNVSDNKPIVCAGVVVNPGDVVFADDDGVVVVPQGIADEVARRAALVQEKDKPGRQKGYDALGIPLDDTVK
jgi:regulator of RNase E activity RraA